MGHISYSQDAATALNLRSESRKQAEQANAERDVEVRKIKLLQSMTGLDIAENFDTDAVTAAIRIGDAELLGGLALMCLDQFAERIAVREVYGHDFVEWKDEELGMQMVNDFIKARAGVTQ
jgi:hypothetical protein